MATIRLGEILCDDGLITVLQLAEALQIQKEERNRIGNILVDLDYLSKRQLRYVVRQHKRRIPLGEYLSESGLVSLEALEAALSKQQNTQEYLGTILIEDGVITEEQLAKALSEQLDIPYIRPYLRMVDGKVFKRLPETFIRHNKILPLSQSNGATTVLVPGLISEAVCSQLESVFGQNVELAIGPVSKIEEIIETLLRKGGMPFMAEAQLETEFVSDADSARKDMSSERLRELGAETSAVDLLNYLVDEALKEDVSDIHLESMPDRLRVRFRVNGLLRHKTDLPPGLRDSLFRRIKTLAGLDVSEVLKEQEGRLTGRLGKMNVDLRVSVFVSLFGESLSMRVLRPDMALMDLDDLDMTPNAYAMCRRSLDYASGMVVFSGPPASGKTVSMYAALNGLNKPESKIVTIEDPVEYVIPGAIQGQPSPRTGSTLTTLMSAIVHLDPDIIVVGEMPSGKEAHDVLSAAMRGHKVLTTLHADDTVGALLRMIEGGIEGFLRSSTALTIICQRLLRKICPNCKCTHLPDPDAIRQFPVRDFDPDKYDFYYGQGCSSCNHTGFSGRVGVFEVMIVNDELREAILKRAPAGEILTIARATMPFLTINEMCVLKAIYGMTTVEEVLRVAPLVSREREMKNPLSMWEIERISEGSTFS